MHALEQITHVLRMRISHKAGSGGLYVVGFAATRFPHPQGLQRAGAAGWFLTVAHTRVEILRADGRVEPVPGCPRLRVRLRIG